MANVSQVSCWRATGTGSVLLSWLGYHMPFSQGHSWCAGDPHARWRVWNEEVTVAGVLAFHVLVLSVLLVRHSICTTTEGTGMPTSLTLSAPLAVDPVQELVFKQGRTIYSFFYSKRTSG